MTTLVTGAGLVGCEAARQMSAAGQDCLLADIREPGDAILALPGVTFALLDVTDAASLSALIKAHGIRRVVHTAAVLSNGMRADPIAGLRVNLLGTANVLQAARLHGLDRVVTLSSTTVVYSGFGGFGPEPIPEDAALRTISDRPRSLYAMTKIAGEQLGHLFQDLYGVDHIALRFAAVVGGETGAPTSVPGQLFQALVSAAQSGGRADLKPLWVWGGNEEFVDLRDCGRAILAALGAAEPGQGVFTIAHPRLWTLREVVDQTREIHGPFECDVPEGLETGFAGFPFHRPAPSDLRAARRALGFECRHDLVDTLAHWWPERGRSASPI